MKANKYKEKRERLLKKAHELTAKNIQREKDMNYATNELIAIRGALALLDELENEEKLNEQ